MNTNIPVAQEVDYLTNFIDLEKLRYDENIELIVDIDRRREQLAIAPFILIPFVENAFKHVSQHKDSRNWIGIKLSLQGSNLELTVANSFSSAYGASTSPINSRGIGLRNVKRRLELLYPDTHSLFVAHHEKEFKIRLLLSLSQYPHLENTVHAGEIKPTVLWN